MSRFPIPSHWRLRGSDGWDCRFPGNTHTHRNTMNYTLTLPEGYVRLPFPGLDEWTADLRANPDKQCSGALQKGNNFCCLGRLSLLQGRLQDGCDGKGGNKGMLSSDNPLMSVLGHDGRLPSSVALVAGYLQSCLSNCNDNGFSFPQIADILDTLYVNSGPLTK